ncbi:MAG: hypothetical protein K2X63_01615 [Burkholderiaceae bacterium]|jgi:hypothetical protein|nr:hypothetical protein [Burkholderiaceae bacterium]
MSTFKYAAIDPMALILSDHAYLTWVEMHHPHEPALSKIGEVVRSLPAEEKRFALAKAKSFIAYGKAVEENLQNRL